MSDQRESRTLVLTSGRDVTHRSAPSTQGRALIRFGAGLLFVILFAATPSATHARTIEFSGETWDVKSGFGGPGPNRWSDAVNSVWVDEQERLHMTVRKIGSLWYSSEVISQVNAGYGDYRFEVSTNTELLDPQVVVGMFTYLNDENEIDIELSKWGNPGLVNTGQFVVQPYYISGNMLGFPLDLSGTDSTHIFKWREDSISFLSYEGHGPEPPSPGDIIQQWTYTGANVPPDSSEKMRINFWQFQGLAPQTGLDQELIINSATFVPFPYMPGDFDHDGDVDGDDIDLLMMNLGDPDFDLDGDNDADDDDTDMLIHDILLTEYGDANLDRIIDLSDYDIQSGNFQTAGGWADGNFDSDPLIDFEDFVRMALNFGYDNSETLASIPEPAGLLLLGGLFVLWRRR